MIDIILLANERSDFLTFARKNGLQTQDSEGNWNNRSGFSYVFWGTDGKLMRTPKTERAKLPISAVQDKQVGIRLPGATLPAWVDGDTTIELNGEVLGKYSRETGGVAGFVIEDGKSLNVGDEVSVFSAPTYVPGFVVLLRIHGDLFKQDKRNPDEGEIDENGKSEQQARSKIVRGIVEKGKRNDVEDIASYELDGVRILRAQDAIAKMTEWGVPGHEWAGGNSY